MPLKGTTWEFDEPDLRLRFPGTDARKLPDLAKLVDILVGWRRLEPISKMLAACAPLHRDNPMEWDALKLKAADNSIQTIGGRKGNARNVGQYRDTPPPQARSVAIYLPSAKGFLRGELGNVFTGILVLTNGFRSQDIGKFGGLPSADKARDREMIFLVPNNPPTPEQEAAASIREPYVNRPFTPAQVNKGFGLDTTTGGRIVKNVTPVVHGGEGNTSHEQLRKLIVGCNRYIGVIRDEEDPVDGQGKMIGFTVMKGGFRPGTHERLENVYGWTSNSMNRKVWRLPTEAYTRRRLQGVEPDKVGVIMGRLKAQVADIWADKIQAALDRLLNLQLTHASDRFIDPRSGTEKTDRNFFNIIQYLEM